MPTLSLLGRFNLDRSILPMDFRHSDVLPGGYRSISTAGLLPGLDVLFSPSVRGLEAVGVEFRITVGELRGRRGICGVILLLQLLPAPMNEKRGKGDEGQDCAAAYCAADYGTKGLLLFASPTFR